MAFCEFHYFSEALQKQSAAHILLPEGKGRGPFPVLYLLHGLSDDHTIWMRRSNIERHVGGWPLIVVIPDGGCGFYCDAVEGFAYQTAIVRDLVNTIDTFFHTKAERKGRCIGGLSMGGYGAIKLALQYPDLFVSAHSHSGCPDYGHGGWTDLPGTKQILGDKLGGGGPNDLYRLAAEAKGWKQSKRPELWIDCGTKDALLKENRHFSAYLKKLRLPHVYKEFPGGHSWEYWDRHIQDALVFHAKHLGFKP
ncbi:MAG: esterase family protein [Methylacidiphilales bacterium]|nr:esterase family protein [Candidatus Methylacidiphilales bacterium]